MGKKVSPLSLRIGITRTWDSLWYAEGGDFKDKLLQDFRVREFLKKKFKKANAAISKFEIHRSAGKVSVIIHTAKPGVIIGRSGENITLLTKELRQKFNDNFNVSIQEIHKADANAQLIADNIAEQVSRRFPYRRVCKMALERAKENGVKGVKIKIAGRLNGVDIARSEKYSFGKVPLHTLRANIDYATSKSATTYGSIGIKVWVFHGMVFKNQKLNAE